MNEALRTRAGLLTGSLSVAAMLLLAACQPIVDPAALSAQAGSATPEATTEATAEAVEEPAETAAGATTPEPTTEATEEATEEPSLDVEPATATVNTRSLRVRQEPNEASEQIASIREGDTYDVLGISSDGNWIQLALPEVDGGEGWVSTGFVTLQGDITNIQTTAVIDSEATAPGASEAEAPADAEAEPEATATAAPEEEEVAEATPTAEPEEEAVATPEAEATATAEPEEEAVATPEAEEEVVATPEAEEETDAEAVATPAPVEEADNTGIVIVDGVAQPAPGYALVVIDGTDALRVRSAPTTAEDNKVGNVRNGEAYQVLEVSPDGAWVRIDVPALNLEDGGWVSADFVVIGE